MRNRRIIHRAVLLSVSCFFIGCASTHAPQGWLASPAQTQSEAYGGWLNVQYLSATKQKAKLAGELIALSDDTVFIATKALHAIALSDIKSARLAQYRSDATDIGGVVFLGTLSTLSNGFLLVFTAPMWIIGGSATASRRSFEPIMDFPKREWRRFVPFARFPQGLPEGIDRDRIRMKPPRRDQ